jgi:RNA polymerase primary sigma factor
LEKIKIMATKEKEEVETEREGATDGPLLDLSDDAVKKMIKAKKRLCHHGRAEFGAAFRRPPAEIEDTMAMPADMGINVTRTTRARASRHAADAEEYASEPAEQTSTALPPRPPRKSRPTRTDDPCACICARWLC